MLMLPLLLVLVLVLVLAAPFVGVAAPASMPEGYSCGLRSGSKSSEVAALRALPLPPATYRLVVAADGPPKAPVGVGGTCELREVGACC